MLCRFPLATMAKYLLLDIDEQSLKEEIQDTFDGLIYDYQNKSEDARFLNAYSDFIIEIRNNEEKFEEDGDADTYAERAERTFSKLWERYSDSAFYHPPYVVPCEEDSFVSLLLPEEENPCVDGVVTLEDTLTPMFELSVDDNEYDPTLWVNQPSVAGASGAGPPQDVVTVYEIIQEFAAFYVSIDRDPGDGVIEAINKFKAYFEAEKEQRTKLLESRVALLEAQRNWQLTIAETSMTESSRAAVRTLESAGGAAAESEEDEPEGPAASFSSNLAADFKMQQAQDRLEVKRMKLGVDREALNAFRSSEGYREWESARRYATTQLKMAYQNKRERLIKQFSSSGLTGKAKNRIAEQLQQVEDKRDKDMRELREEFDEQKRDLLEQWGSNPEEDNGEAHTPTAAQTSRAQERAKAAQELAKVVSDGAAFAGAAGGRTNTGRSSRIQETRTVPQMSRADFRAMQKARGQARISEAKAQRQAKINRLITRLEVARIDLENAKQEQESLKYSLRVRDGDNSDEAIKIKKNIRERLGRIETKIIRYGAEIQVAKEGIVELGASVPAKKRSALSMLDDSGNDSDDEGAGARFKKQKTQKREAVPEKPSVERLTATFGTSAEIAPETPPAVATVTAAKPPAVIKKKRRSRVRKKKGLSTKKSKPSLQPGNLIF